MCLPSLFFVNVELTVDVAHLLLVEEDQRDEDVHRSLVGEPEPERIATQRDAVERRREEDACAERDQEPDNQDLGQQAQYRSPVRLAVVFHHASSICLKHRRRVNPGETIPVMQRWANYRNITLTYRLQQLTGS